MKTTAVAQFRQLSRPLRRIARDIGITGIAGCALVTAGLLTMLYLEFGAAPAPTAPNSATSHAAAATPDSPLTPAVRAMSPTLTVMALLAYSVTSHTIGSAALYA